MCIYNVTDHHTFPEAFSLIIFKDGASYFRDSTVYDYVRKANLSKGYTRIEKEN